MAQALRNLRKGCAHTLRLLCQEPSDLFEDNKDADRLSRTDLAGVPIMDVVRKTWQARKVWRVIPAPDQVA